MKSKTFVILLALCAVLGIATYLVSTSDRNSVKKQSAGEDKFLSELPVNDIVSISVKDAENEVVLEKGESVWQVKNRFGYAADFGKIAEFAKKLKDSKVGRTFEVTEDMRSRLALHSPEEADIPPESKGTRVTLKDKAGRVLADVIIGKPREASSGFGGHYLMAVGGRTVYLVDKDYNYMEKKPSEWIQTDLLDVKAADVREVVCTDSKTGNVIYTLRRPEKGKDPELLNAPADKKLIPARLNNVMSALDGFAIENVADPAEKAEDTGTDALRLIFRMFDGTEYTAYPGKASKEDAEKYYVRLNAAYVPPPEPEKPAEESAPAEAESKPAETGDKSDAVPDAKAQEKTAPAEKDAAASPENKDSADVKPADAKPEEKPGAVPDAKSEVKTGLPEKDAGAEKADDPGAKDSPQDKGANQKAEDKPDPAKLAADAAEINKKISAWTYIIPKWKAERLIASVEEFFEKPKAEEEAEGRMSPTPQSPPVQ